MDGALVSLKCIMRKFKIVVYYLKGRHEGIISGEANMMITEVQVLFREDMSPINLIKEFIQGRNGEMIENGVGIEGIVVDIELQGTISFVDQQLKKSRGWCLV